MTRVITPFQRILGLTRAGPALGYGARGGAAHLTPMEHHRNPTSWLETIAEVEGLPPDKHGLVDPVHLAEALDQHRTNFWADPLRQRCSSSMRRATTTACPTSPAPSTNPWGDYIQDIERCEDGGTPAFLQTIKTALVGLQTIFVGKKPDRFFRASR